MIIFTHYMVNFKCRKAPLFAFGRTLPGNHEGFVSKDVIGQVPHSNFGPCPGNADGAQYQIPGHHGLNAKDMFNPASCFRPRAVATLFSLCKFLMTASFSLKMLAESPLGEILQPLFGPVGRIRKDVPARVGIIQNLIKYLAVMCRSIRDSIITDQFVLYINIYMILVTIVGLTHLLGPASIRIFLPAFSHIPVFGDFPFLDPFILITAIALFRSRYNTGINDLAFLGCKSTISQELIKLPEEFFDKLCLLQPLAEQPNRLGIGDTVSKSQAQKSHKGNPVHYLVFNRIIGKIVQRLDYKDLKHHYNIVGLSPRTSFPLLFMNDHQGGAKTFPINQIVEMVKRITVFFQILKTKLPVEKSPLHFGSFFLLSGHELRVQHVETFIHLNPKMHDFFVNY